jgi:hypothetical protein
VHIKGTQKAVAAAAILVRKFISNELVPKRKLGQEEQALVLARDPLYRGAAHLIVETGRQPVDRVVGAVLAGLPASITTNHSAPPPEVCPAERRPNDD